MNSTHLHSRPQRNHLHNHVSSPYYPFVASQQANSPFDDPVTQNRGVAAATVAAAAAQQFYPFVQHSSTSAATFPADHHLSPPTASGFYNNNSQHLQQIQRQIQQQQHQHQLHQRLLQQQQQQQQLQQQYYNHYRLPSQNQYMMAPSPHEQGSTSQEPSPAAAAGLTDEQMAEYQKLSNEYEPEATGPLVGQRQPSTAITTEYASADPAYQRKTAALPQKYSHYRTVRGDGRCGWRAIAFGYFETIIALADHNRFLTEEARLRSLSTVLNNAGYDPMLYEDFAEETFDLLRRLATANPADNAESILLETFNNEETQNYIITHLKTLTSAWMKTHQEDYVPWLLGQSVDSYTDSSVMPILSEIDHVSLSALKDVFLSPAFVSLEVLYLDRSDGDEVNMHQFLPLDTSQLVIGTVRLLYRPGHYDILYKQGDLAPMSITVPTYFQFGTISGQEPVHEIGISDCLHMIPGMSFAGPPQSLDWLPSSSASAHSSFSGPSPSKQQMQHQYSTQVTDSFSTNAVQSMHSSYLNGSMKPPTVPSHPQSQQQQLVRVLPMRRKTSLDSALPHLASPGELQSAGPFRSSAWELEPDFVQATSQGPLRTRAFQNSHYNTAHFMNPAFHPEQWHPGDEDSALPGSSSLSRHKST